MSTKVQLTWKDLDHDQITKADWDVGSIIWDLEHLKSHLQTNEVKQIIFELGQASVVLDQLADLVRHEQSPKRPAQAPFKVEAPASA